MQRSKYAPEFKGKHRPDPGDDRLINPVSMTPEEFTRQHRLAAKIEYGEPKWQRWATFNRLKDRLKLILGSLSIAAWALGFV